MSKFNKGDTVRCIDRDRRYVTYGRTYEVQDTADRGIYVRDNDGDRTHYSDEQFELASAPGQKFKVGDRVKVIDASTCAYISEGEELTVTSVSASGDRVAVDNRCGGHEYATFRFALLEVAPVVPKLKLPLSATRSTGSQVVLLAGSEAGKVSMMYVKTGQLVENHYSESEVIANFNGGIWTVNGATPDADLTNAVNQAKIALASAEANVTSAQTALATAEAALASNKPYLA